MLLGAYCKLFMLHRLSMMSIVFHQFSQGDIAVVTALSAANRITHTIVRTQTHTCKNIACTNGVQKSP